MVKWFVRVAAVAATLTLVAGCGSGRDDADGGTGSTGDPGSEVSSDVLQFGDLPSPCGPGDPSGSPDQGVDDSTVTIGFGDDAGYQPSPGLGQEAGDAVRAMIEWCNEQGGINGREVVGNYYDAKITEINNVMTEACSQVFMLVGQFFSLPEAAEPTRLGCGLPTVPGISGGALAMAPLAVSPFPDPIDQYNIGPMAILAREFPEEAGKAAMMVADFPGIASNLARFERTVPQAGWNLLGDCYTTYPILGVADFKPYVQRLKECGAEMVYTVDVEPNMQNILDAAAQLDYEPIWVNGASVASASFAKWNVNGNGDRLYFGDSFVPASYDAEGSANAAFLAAVEKTGGDAAYFGQVSASAFLLWATAAKECGDDLTRDCVMTELRKITDWDAGGLSAPQNPAENLIDDCTQVMNLQGTEFVQWLPENEGDFECDPSWAVTVEPPVDDMERLQVGDDRVAHNIIP